MKLKHANRVREWKLIHKIFHFLSFAMSILANNKNSEILWNFVAIQIQEQADV